MATPSQRISIAPMMDWTDRHCRFFLRLLSKHIHLYTEMVTTGAILNGKAERYLAFNEAEHPVALQLGGANPLDLAASAKVGARFGYDEINLNVGCPSDRVQGGHFGACLMAEPDLVARCVAAMKESVDVDVTVKTRIGIDDKDSYAELVHFIGTVANAGCEKFIIHARKAWLHGLSPKENRTIPPLRYDVVRQLKADFPNLLFELNGGITSLDQVAAHLADFDGVMLGRVAYENPYILAEVDARFYGAGQGLTLGSAVGAGAVSGTGSDLNSGFRVQTRAELLDAFKPYLEGELSRGVRLHSMTRHILGLFQGVRGGRVWRRYLSENDGKPGAGIEVLDAALAAVNELA